MRDGRAIGRAEYGDPAGDPVLWFPGTPDSRLAAPPDEALTRELGVRLITIERPGFGVSDPADVGMIGVVAPVTEPGVAIGYPREALGRH